MLIRCTKSQAVHLRPLVFFAFVVARKVEGALCLVALMTAIWKRSEQTMLASTGRTVLCQTLIAIMRQSALPNASITVARIMTRFQRR